MSWDDERDSNRQAKESLISEAWSVSSTDDFRWGGDEMADLMNQWKGIGSAGQDNDRLWEEFRSARQAFFDRREADKEQRQSERDSNYRKKEQLISRAESAARTTDWKAGGQTMADLMEEWKGIGSAGRDENNELWERFNSARRTFYDNRDAAREQREAEKRSNASDKRRLISRAESLSGSTDWNATHEALQGLRAEWKTIGHAGKDEDQQLWEEFNGAMQVFYNNRKEDQEKRARERKENADAKRELISKAVSLSGSTDWNATHEALQGLREKWKGTGSAGKDENDRLWAEFSDATQVFYANRKRAYDKRDADRKASASKKEGIISQAKNLVNPSNWDSAHEDMKDLMESWKRAGSAGGNTDNTLWEEFNRIRKNFYEHYKAWKNAQRSARMSPEERNQRDLERTMRKTLGGDRSKWGNYVETGRDERGRAISRSTIGSEGYTLSTRDGDKKGKTTGHRSGDIHKHGSHSRGRGTDHHTDGGSPPSGKIIDDYMKPKK